VNKKKIWIVMDQDNKPVAAFKKKPTVKSLMTYYELHDEPSGREIAEDILATATSLVLDK